MAQERPVRKAMRLANYDYASAGYYFVTVCTRVRNQHILCHLSSVGGGLCAAPPPPVLTPIGRAVEDAICRIPQLYPGTKVDIYCIMPDHIHLILALSGRHGDRPLQDIIGRLKSYTQAQYRRLFQPSIPLWQESFYDHILRNDTDLSETRRYIRENPTAHTEKEEYP